MALSILEAIPVSVGNGPFKLKALKEQILDFNPMSGGGKLISEQLNKNNIHELLSLFRCSPVILIPLLENLV